MAAWLAGALGLVSAIGCAGQAEPDNSWIDASAYGPRAAAAPPGAAVADDAHSLRQLLTDPHGPREIWLGARTYRGDWQIRRTVALHGTGQTVLAGSGTATVVEILADDVTLTDLRLRDSGSRHTAEDSALKATGKRIALVRLAVDGTLFGLSLQQCKQCLVQDCLITGRAKESQMPGDGIKLWESPHSRVERNLVRDSRDLVVWYSRHVSLTDNVVVGSRYGAHFMYAHDSLVQGQRVRDNVVGIFVMYSNRLRVVANELSGARGPAGVGIGFKESDTVTVQGNWIVGNTTGVYLDNTPRAPDQPVRFVGNELALNDVALRLHASPAGLSFEANDFHHNGEVVHVDGGGDALGVAFTGNHWTDYIGYDRDGDGSGDVAFEVKRLSSEWADHKPATRLLHGTLALGLVETVARAVPVMQLHKALVDPRPAMARPAAVPRRSL